MIEPVSIPTAAGVPYGEGDVRHFAEGDSMDVAGLSMPTRYLAQRDNLLAEKVNELVGAANNTEQYVALPLPALNIPADAAENVYNFRIPPGFEARVLNAVVCPQDGSVELDVLWDSGYGSATGTRSIIATSTETTGGTGFSPTGEFIVILKNKGATTQQILASVGLSIRPTSTMPAALLPGPLVIRERGVAIGVPGQIGPTGEGTVGPPGLTYRGLWDPGAQYQINDIAVCASGTINQAYSSYVCLVANSDVPPTPAIANGVAAGGAGDWGWLASAGNDGATGPTGSLAATSAATPIVKVNQVPVQIMPAKGWYANAYLQQNATGTAKIELAEVVFDNYSMGGATLANGNPIPYISNATAIGNNPSVPGAAPVLIETGINYTEVVIADAVAFLSMTMQADIGGNMCVLLPPYQGQNAETSSVPTGTVAQWYAGNKAGAGASNTSCVVTPNGTPDALTSGEQSFPYAIAGIMESKTTALPNPLQATTEVTFTVQTSYGILPGTLILTFGSSGIFQDDGNGFITNPTGNIVGVIITNPAGSPATRGNGQSGYYPPNAPATVYGSSALRDGTSLTLVFFNTANLAGTYAGLVVPTGDVTTTGATSTFTTQTFTAGESVNMSWSEAAPGYTVICPATYSMKMSISITGVTYAAPGSTFD